MATIFKYIFLLTILLTKLFGQDTHSDSLFRRPNIPFKGKFGCKVGINYNYPLNHIKADIGLYQANQILKNDFSTDGNRSVGIYNHNLFISTEFNLNNNFILGPKIGYELNLLIFQIRLNIIDYTNLQQDNLFVFRPDIGLTFFGLFSISYGYNVFLAGNNFNMVDRHTIGLTYNMFLLK